MGARSSRQSRVERVVITIVIILVAVCFVAGARAQTPSPSALVAERGENYYGAADRVDINSPMPADVIVAGRQVDIAQPVAGDILAAGWRVALTGRANDDVRIAGSEVVVNAPVDGDLTVAGGEVTLGPRAHVAGRSWITGRTVRVEGALDNRLDIAAATVQIAGEARRPMRIVAEKLEILPGARILAPLTYKGSTEMTVAEGAIVNGPVTYERIPEREARRAHAFPTFSTVMFSIHLFIAGLLVLMLAPRAEASIVETLRQHPWKSLLSGFVLAVTTPVAALLLVISLLGLPFGLALGALYGVALFAGVLATAFFVGDLEGKLARFGPAVTRRQQASLLLAGVLTIALLRSIFGGFIVFVSVLFGLGAFALWLYQQRSGTGAAATA